MPSLPPPPPPPQFFPTQFQPNEMCYSAIPQAVYPLFAVNTLDSTVYASTGCEVADPPSSNISAEVSFLSCIKFNFFFVIYNILA